MSKHTATLIFALACVLGLSACATAPSHEGPRTVVITGASSGFGRGVALALAARGDNVVIAARRGEVLEDLARQAGGTTLVVPTDVSHAGEVARLAQAAIPRFGSIDVWINDAGVGALGRFTEIPLAGHERVLDVNLKGALYGSYSALQHFEERERGTLINIASVAGRVPFPYYASYVSSKHAVVGLGASLNQELRLAGKRNIHVVTINPFAADTPFFDQRRRATTRRGRRSGIGIQAP
jgi:short-subunit dehydrogenase